MRMGSPIGVALLGAALVADPALGQASDDQSRLKDALAHLYQARDELNAGGAKNSQRDRALHDVYAAIDETRGLVGSGSGDRTPGSHGNH